MTGTEPALHPGPELEDGAALLAADRGGLLRGAASAGAQVRATATDLAEGGLERLRGAGTRSVVLVAAGGPAARAAQLVVAAAGPRAGVPVLHLPAVPRWVGPLDVVVVATDDPGDVVLAESVGLAVRRGAEVVLVAPAEGPLAAATAGRAVLCPPRVVVPAGLEHVRFAVAALGVLGALAGAELVPTALLADELDRDAERNHAGADLFANPAKSLAARMQDRAVVLAGDGPAALAVAAHAADQLLLRTGTGAVAAELRTVLAGAAAAPPPADAVALDPFFHDPLIDGAPPAPPARVFLLAPSDDAQLLRVRAAGLPDVDLVSSDVATAPLAGDPLAELLLLVPRLETAAVLLGLLAGGAGERRG